MLKLLLLLTLSGYSLAETPPTGRVSLHTALEDAVNNKISNGCYEINIRMPLEARYKVVGGYITGASLDVTCVKEGRVQALYVLSWDIPATREDGSPLKGEDLEGYELSMVSSSGIEVFPVEGGGSLQYKLPHLPTGEYSISIVAIDLEGLKSLPSEALSFTVEN